MEIIIFLILILAFGVIITKLFENMLGRLIDILGIFAIIIIGLLLISILISILNIAFQIHFAVGIITLCIICFGGYKIVKKYILK